MSSEAPIKVETDRPGDETRRQVFMSLVKSLGKYSLDKGLELVLIPGESDVELSWPILELRRKKSFGQSEAVIRALVGSTYLGVDSVDSTEAILACNKLQHDEVDKLFDQVNEGMNGVTARRKDVRFESWSYVEYHFCGGKQKGGK